MLSSLGIFDSPAWVQITTFGSVVAVDLTLAIDNALVMSMAVANLPSSLRKKAIAIGLAGAVLFRLLFSVFAIRLLRLVGLTLAGGLLLSWVAWRLWRDIRRNRNGVSAENEALAKYAPTTDPQTRDNSMRAVWQIAFADISMSLDNTLAVAGTARNHLWIMVFGLVLSVVFMGVAANLMSGLVKRYQWASYLGFLIVVYVALKMVWEGARQVASVL